MQVSRARDAAGSPPRCLPQSSKNEMKAVVAVSLVGQPAQTEAVSLVNQPAQIAKDPMDVSSTLKTSSNTVQGNTTQMDSIGPVAEKKTKAKVHIKKIAREHHRNKSPQPVKELLSVGKKGEGSLYLTKKKKSLCRRDAA